MGLDWQQYIKVDERFLRPLDVEFLHEDYPKAKQKLGWHLKVKFEKLLEIMVEEELDHWQRWRNGEIFPWDAPNYPGEAMILTWVLSA